MNSSTSLKSYSAPLPTIREIREERARREEAKRLNDIASTFSAIRARCSSLAGFCKEAWHILEPETKLVWGWALDAMCAHLEAVTRGEITRLLINVPPGMMKSLLVNVFWPAWEWGPCAKPWVRTLASSYSPENVSRDNEKNKKLVESGWYQELWGDTVKMDGTSRGSIWNFSNTATGGREGRSFVAMTGGRADRVPIDDPNSTVGAESETRRKSTNQIFRESISDRLNDMQRSVIVVIMQRLHSNDVSGTILSLNLPYVHLCLPMEFEPDRRCETFIDGRIFFQDPRTQPGELLFAERFPAYACQALRTIKGEVAWAGQYQQRPSPREGNVFKRGNFEIVDTLPLIRKWCRGWDLASTAVNISNADPDWTAGVKIGLGIDGVFYIAHAARFRINPAGVRAALINYASQDGWICAITIPKDPGAAGKTVAELYIGDLAGYSVKAVSPTGEKTTRAQPLRAQSEIHAVKLLRGDWNEAFLAEIETFPTGSHDDQVDAAADAFNDLAGVTGGEGIMEYYRRLAEEANSAAEKDRSGPKPLTAEGGGVRMKAPDGVFTAVYGMAGNKYTPDSDGLFLIGPEDVGPLTAAGFQNA